ncbi:MAG TPA: ATP-binding protein [Thermoplasmata archaeon]|nr:ATP-binding protein [Thermoplasmata archaeon]
MASSAAPGDPIALAGGAAVLDALSAGVLVYRPDGTIAFVNRAAHEIVGPGVYRVGDTFDQSQLRLFRDDRVTPVPPEDRVTAAAFRGEIVPPLDRFVRTPTHPNGRVLSVAARPLVGPDGTILGAVATFTDVTEARRAQYEMEVLERLEDLLARAPETATSFADALREMNRVSGWTISESWILDPKEGALRAADVIVTPPDGPDAAAARDDWFAATQLLRIRPGEALIGRAFAERELQIDRVLGDHRAAYPRGEIAVRLGVRGAVALPVLAHGAPLTVVFIGVQDPTLLDDRFATFAHRLAEIGGRFAERRIVADQLRVAYAAERQANESRAAFFAHISHEVRQPLNAIVGLSEILTDTLTLEERREYARIIRTGALGLLSLINDILDLSRIESGRFSLEERPVDVAAIVEDAIDLVAAQANQKGLDLSYTIDPLVPATILGDSQRLRQILLNLVGNAVKFTDRGEVTVRVRARPVGLDRFGLMFSVRDTGPGIPRSARGALFQGFQQADPSVPRRYGGSGLGLAISRNLAELMGGTLWLDEKASPGATFHFTVVVPGESTPSASYPRDRAPWLEGKRVELLVERPGLGAALAEWLTAWGATPSVAATPAEAIDQMRRAPPNLLVHDGKKEPLPVESEMRALSASGGATVPIVRIVPGPGHARASDEAPLFVRRVLLGRPVKPRTFRLSLERALNVGGSVGPAGATGEADEARGVAQHHPLRVLVVEDSPVNQQVADLLLRRLGYRAEFVESGELAIEAVERSAFDVVLMDIELGGLDGVEATRRIRAQRGVAADDPWIVALTAHGSGPEIQRMRAAGMNDYLPKPMRLEELRKALESSPRFGGAIAPAAPPASGPPAQGTGASGPGTRLDELATMARGDDRGFVVGLISAFLPEAEKLLAAMEAGVAAHQRDPLQRAAHRLKSASWESGAAELGEKCREIEEACAHGHLDEAAALLPDAWKAFHTIRPTLEALRTEAGGPAPGGA